MLGRGFGPLLVVLLALAAAAPAGAAGEEVPTYLQGSAAGGVVDLALIAPAGSRATITERVAGQDVPVRDVTAEPGPDGRTGGARIYRAATWRCDRLLRHFDAAVTTLEGEGRRASTELRTPGCGRRLAVSVPRQVAPGGTLRVVVKDLWGRGGLDVDVCTRRPARPRTCRTVVLAAGTARAVDRRAVGTARGRLDVAVRYGRWFRASYPVGVGRAVPRAQRPVLLATGDSLVQGVDSFLGDRLGRSFDVVRDSRPGTGVTKSVTGSWTARARRQAATRRPAVTVVMLGANDQFPIGDASCCGSAWRAAYLDRVTAMARSWAAPRHGRVLWITLPAPRDPRLVPAFRAINATLLRLARTIPAVELVRADELLSPDGEFHESIGGEVVRDPDGIHLSVHGAELVADAVVEAVRRPAAPR